MSPSSADAATATFQRALPRVLQPASPALAAYHATRTRSNHGDDSEHCQKCGYYLYAGTSSTRLVRRPTNKKRKHRRVEGDINEAHHNLNHLGAERELRRTCRACAHTDRLTLDSSQSGYTSAFPTVRRRKHVAFAPTPVGPVSVLPQSALEANLDSRPNSPPITTTPIPSRSPSVTSTSTTKSRPKKKKSTGLQDLLTRNREKQAREGASTSGQGGLSAFLSGL